MTAIARKPWFWAWVAAALTFVPTAMLSQGTGGAWDLAAAALTFASFSIFVGLGQMMVITLGPGNADLSIPATMTLAGTLSLKLMDGAAGTGWAGLLVALAVGLGCGAGNYLLILLLRIPPIVATLAASFLYLSFAIWSNRGLRIKPPDWLADFATGAPLGLPNIALIATAFAVLFWVVLDLSVYGRWVSAIGQSPRAARLSGVPVDLARASAYVLSAVMAALCGFLLSCFSGGAALNMGTEYLLISIAVVVIGGSSIAGGNSNVPGILGASLFLFLVVSMLNSYGLGAGVRLIMTGVIIIAIVAAASGRKGAS
ncbi:MAG: ABC transporter permease [Paracoccaceae bacterium]